MILPLLNFNSSLNKFNRNVNTAFGIQKYLTNTFEKINIDYSSVTTKVFLQTVFFTKFSIGGGLIKLYSALNTISSDVSKMSSN